MKCSKLYIKVANCSWHAINESKERRFCSVNERIMNVNKEKNIPLNQ
jgi:hypothetical protein